ncbi:MAG: exosortase A [bacterium]
MKVHVEANRLKKNQLVIIITLFLLLYYPIFPLLIHQWFNDSKYSHGFLIPFIAGYLLWQRRSELMKVSLLPTNWGAVILISGLFFYILGHIGGELFTMRFSMLVVIAGLIIYLTGYKMFKLVLFPLLFLIFMIPLPAVLFNSLTFPLQLLAAKTSMRFIYFLGIPVLREGNIIHLANTSLEVAEACSGLRSLNSFLALTATYAALFYKSRIRQWVLFISAVPVAIFVNIVRVTVTAIGVQLWGEQVAQGLLHESVGLVVFGMALGILLLIARK